MPGEELSGEGFENGEPLTRWRVCFCPWGRSLNQESIFSFGPDERRARRFFRSFERRYLPGSVTLEVGGEIVEERIV